MTIPAASPLQRRQITILMCDLVGFTAITDRVDPEELAEGMHAYRQLCTATIERHGGMVAQYIGDGIMAYFGYPRSREDDAERAVRAALALVSGAPNHVPALGELRLHIGVATGMVVVGNMPDPPDTAGERPQSPHHDVAAVGLAVNLAARLQALAPPGVALVADETHALTRQIFRYDDFGRHLHKGFGHAQQAWRVVGERSLRSRFSALRPTELTPLVGRSDEVRRLRDLFRATRGGTGHAVLLIGDPGVGKSRLAEALASSIGPDEGLCLWYSCWPHLQNTPLAPLVRHLVKAIGIKEGEEPDAILDRIQHFVRVARADADELVPLLAALLGISHQARYPGLQMSPQRQKAQLFALLLQTLGKLAAARPVLVVIEDLHWIDPSTDELIGIFIEQLKSLPVLAVLTARPDFEPRWDHEEHVEVIELQPLAPGESIAMIESICGQRDVPDATVRAIAQRADGMPLFIEDLTRDLLERAASPLQASSQGIGPIPMTLTDALAARLDRLGPARRIAQVAAVIGREFSYALLSSVCQLAEEDLKEELRRLVASGLVVSNRASLASAYAFKHALVRDAAYASLLRKEQQALHAQIATVLVEQFPDTAQLHPELVAQHLESAGLHTRAVPRWVEAARLASRRSGFAEALAILEHALTLLHALPSSRDRDELEIDVYCTLGAVNVRHRGFSAPESSVAYRAALDRCRALGDVARTCAVLSALGSYEITVAHFEECRKLAAECLDLAGRQSREAPHVMGHRLLGGTLFLQGEFAAARPHLEEALARYERDPDAHRSDNDLFVQDHKSTALCYLALTLTLLGEVDAGRQAALAGLAHSRSLNDAHTVNFSLCYLAGVCHIAGDPVAAWRYASESLALAREQDFATWIGFSQLVRGDAAIAAGRTEEGFAEVMAGIAAHRDTAAVSYQTLGASIVLRAMLGIGRTADAAALAEKAIAMAESTGERFYLAEILRLKAQVLLATGDPAASQVWLARSMDLAVRQGARLFVQRADPQHRSQPRSA